MIREVNYATYSVDHRDSLRIVTFNDGFRELTGFDGTDIYRGKMTQRDIIPPHLWEEYLAVMNHSRHSGDGSGYLEHPILRKDGSSIIVLCYGKKRDDGSDISDILITDVTSHIVAHDIVLKQAKEQRLWLRTLSFISENDEEYIVDYNCLADHFDITRIKDGEAQNIYSVDNYTATLSHIPTIHPDDLEDYANVFLNAPKLKKRETFDFRSSLFTDNFCWYRATYAPYFDKETGETHIIGKIVDVNHEVTKNQELKRQAQTDSLTSLYNQGTARTKINEIALENPDDNMNAFIIMDLDDFKNINDTFGHTVGDNVLKNVGDLLKHFFKFGSDIIGRLGGDEFVIFMRDIPSESLVKKYCEDLCHQLSTPYTTPDGVFRLTVSIGIAIQRNGPDSFDHLYKCADEALYRRKLGKKNGVCIYQ